MRWTIEYFEQADMTQPAEIFEDALDTTNTKLAGKLSRVTSELQFYGHHLGGGYIKKCYEYEGVWEIRVIHGGMLAREFFGFDKNSIILLHGYTKRTGEAASAHHLQKAHNYLTEYIHTRRVSPIQEK